MATLSELAGQQNFRLGPIDISPSRRLLSGPAGSAHLEPIIMQALLILGKQHGVVVTRDTLFTNCWGAAAVGDDSLNRAVAGVRRALEQVAPGAFEVETIPRTGYRLIQRATAAEAVPADPVWSTTDRRVTRRTLVGGAVAVAVGGGAGLWWMGRARQDRNFEAVMARGDQAFRDGSAFEWPSILPNYSKHMVALYEEAVGLRPDNAKAWGLLAYFRSAQAQGSSPAESAAAIASAKTAIDRALALDPKESNARVANFLFEGRMMDWTTRDRRLRDILASDPRNIPAMIELMPLLQAAGLTRESWIWNERILEASPLAKTYLVVKALKLWILGRTVEADNVIDRVRGLWPEYAFGAGVRFNIFALTGRPEAALAMLDSARQMLDQAQYAIPRIALEAMIDGTPEAIEKARLACRDAARKAPGQVNDLVMYLGKMGLIDDAFEVTNGFILWRGKIVTQDQADGRTADHYNRRMTQWLFTPPLAKMRADPRFARLCDEFGLTAYWKARGIRPDYLRYG